MQRETTVQEIASGMPFDMNIIGEVDKIITHPSSLENGDENAITFCKAKGDEALERILRSNAGAILCDSNVSLGKKSMANKTLIQVDNPRYAFIEIIQRFFTEKQAPCIAKTAVIDDRAIIHPTVSIGDFSYIGACSIGEGSIIYQDVKIYAQTKIGRNVTIHTGVTIGVPDAFSYERNKNGELIKFPHFGGVVIEDNVDIHQHVNIDRATFEDTVIGEGTKINRYAHIGHNSNIGKHCQIGGKCFLAGSCRVGDFSELAFCSCVRDGIKLGVNTMVGMGSVVTKNVEDNCVVYGVPAKKVKENEPHSYFTGKFENK